MRKKYNTLQLSIGLIYLIFGALKFFPNLSPAEDIAKETIFQLTFGLIPLQVGFILLAIWETALGIMLLFNIYRGLAIRIALLHMILTFTPFFLFPERIFGEGHYTFSLLGQYIVKNIIIISALVSLAPEPKFKWQLRLPAGRRLLKKAYSLFF
ncbi:doxx family protein [Christiangramia crocea]|uniref:Doxx family protein n=1 Tax=Christiangramia crocea TaxID=2904124 RepID=A0A9X1UW72_9FLAO|nr:doxx family protein [Gramella crocea]MCG9970594.1 doxx family protein [Gramella crocea]